MQISQISLIAISLTLTFAPLTAFSQNYPQHELLNYNELTWSGFLDSYAAHDFNDPTGDRPYTTQALVDDELRVNLGLLETKLDNTDWRGRIAIQGGDSVKANYSSERERFFRYIQESSLGYKLSDNLWLDTGIYLSHIGLESFNSRDNWNYTRSLVAEYSPYYETGAKLSYQYDEEWSGQLHVLKGWQNISNDRDPALGMQVTWGPNKTYQFIYNNFIGNEHGLRVFNEILLKYAFNEDFNFGVQFDLGHQNQNYDRGGATWHGWAILSQYKINPKVALGGRVERYSDPHQVLISPESNDSFSAVGMSSNIDIQLTSNVLWRNEYRVFIGQNSLFPKDEGFHSSNQIIVSSLCYSF